MRRLLGAGHTAEAQVFVLHEVPSFLPPNLSLAKDGAAKGGQLTDLAERSVTRRRIAFSPSGYCYIRQKPRTGASFVA